MPNSSVKLELDGKIFTFNEGTLAIEACNSIFNEFKQITQLNLVSIIKNETHQKVNSNYKLKSDEKYTICIMIPVNFRNKFNTNHHSNQIVNYSDKVSNAKKILATIYSIDQFNIVIYDKDTNEIANENKFLREILNSNGEIFFEFRQESKNTPTTSPPGQKTGFTRKYEKSHNLGPNKHSKDDTSATTEKYYYNDNLDDDAKEIDMEKGSTVRHLKEKISKMNNNANMSNIKVIFRGKEILDNSVLSDLKIGDETLFIYIKTTDDILLMTKKAFVLEHGDEDEEYEEEK